MKLNKNILKRVLIVTLWVIGLTGLAVLVSWTGYEENQIVCVKNNIDIKIATDSNLYFVSQPDIMEMIENKGKTVIGNNLCNVNANMLEKMINNYPSVRNSEVFKTIEGKLKINILQRIPVLRVFNKNNRSFYIDMDGKVMPLSPNYSAKVLVANGNIPDSCSINEDVTRFDSSLNTAAINLYKLYLLASYIDKSKFWNSQIAQIYVDENNDIELIPRIGQHIIIFGDIDDRDEKFKKLMLFYKKGLNYIGWNQYKTINLKYKNQIVCTKNNVKNG